MINKNTSFLSPLLFLLIPLIGTLVSEEIQWSFFDFFIMGILILLLSFSIQQVLMKTKNTNYLILKIGAIFLVFLYVWIELAVGIFNTPFAGN